MGKPILSLQVLRCVAASAVAFGHAVHMAAAAHLGPAFVTPAQGAAGSAGVDVFFVLSGAIMYYTTFGDGRVEPGRFIRKRLIRIVPIYFVLTAVWLAIAFPTNYAFYPGQIPTSFTFWPVWNSNVAAPAILAGWSLSFEMLFYLGFFLVLAWRPALWLLISGFVAALASGWMFYSAPLRFLGNPIIAEFLLGVAIMRWGRNVRLPAWLATWLIVLGFAAIVAPGYGFDLFDYTKTLDGSQALQRTLYLGLPAGMIVFGAVGLERSVGAYLATARTGKALVYLGDASYSLYLTNWIAFAVAAPLVLGSHLEPNATIVIATLLCLGLGATVYRFVEKPILDFLRRRPQSQALAAE